MSPLLNYTTSIDVHKTLGEIQGMLASSRARSITVEYDAGEPSAVSFVAETPMGPLPFRLLMNRDAILKVLTRQRDAGRIRSARFVTREQAARVGWRIIKDWLGAQLALIETSMVTLDEVFLPYLIHESGGTLYQAFRDSKIALNPGTVEGEWRALPAASADR